MDKIDPKNRYTIVRRRGVGYEVRCKKHGEVAKVSNLTDAKAWRDIHEAYHQSGAAGR